MELANVTLVGPTHPPVPPAPNAQMGFSSIPKGIAKHALLDAQSVLPTVEVVFSARQVYKRI